MFDPNPTNGSCFRMRLTNGRWKLNLATLDDSGAGEFLGKGVALTVRDVTAEKYSAAVATFILFLVERDIRFDLPGFIRYLAACRKQGAAAGTLSG